MIEAKVTFPTRFIKEMEKLSVGHQVKVDQALAEAAILVQGESQKSIQAHESSGIKYGSHTASKPGYPPNSDTGRLVQSISIAKNDKLSYSVGTNVKYGAWLEFGTLNTAARPWLRPAFLKNIKKIQALIFNALKDSI